MNLEKDKKMVLDFLERHYPVQRFKIQGRFKRAIVLDNGNIYFLTKEPLLYIQLRYDLASIIRTIFSCDEEIIEYALNNFLPLQIRG